MVIFHDSKSKSTVIFSYSYQLLAKLQIFPQHHTWHRICCGGARVIHLKMNAHEPAALLVNQTCQPQMGKLSETREWGNFWNILFNGFIYDESGDWGYFFTLFHSEARFGIRQSLESHSKWATVGRSILNTALQASKLRELYLSLDGKVFVKIEQKSMKIFYNKSTRRDRHSCNSQTINDSGWRMNLYRKSRRFQVD